MKKLIAFLLCFTLLAVGVTYGCIQYTLHAPDSGETVEEVGIFLNGFYDENDLMITEHKEVMQTVDREVHINYPQIDGLKNSEVQTLVNDRIREEAERMQAAYDQYGSKLSFLSSQVHGNFANTLSVGLFSGDDAMHYEQVYLNFNLNDGSLLQMEDLFKTDADLQEIVRTAFYDAVTRGHLGDYYWEEPQSPDEQELYQTVKGYLEAENKKFAFTPAEIYLYWGDYAASVPMVDFADDIVIYSKYLTAESLFEQDGIGYDGVFTCAAIPSGFDSREFGFPEENFWYDVAVMEKYVDDSLPEDVQEQFLGFYSRVYTSMLSEVEAVRELARSNPDRGYILLACPFVSMVTSSEYVDGSWQTTPSHAANVNDNYRLYEMPIALYRSKYLPAMIEEYRGNNYYLFYGGIDEYLDGDEVQLTKRDQEQLYDYTADKKLELQDVFAEGYDYGTALRAQAKYDLTGYYGFTMEEAELQVQQAWFTLGGGGVQVRIPAWGEEQYIWIPLSDFPHSALAIYD